MFSGILFSQNRPQTKEKVSAASMKAGAFIDVNAPTYPESAYSIQQLITDVLISGGSNCTGAISNVNVSPNLSATAPNRTWGYFNKATTSFPFSSGIVLMTGNASNAGNALISSTLSGVVNQNGDADLATAVNVPIANQRDATFIEFDFVPAASQVTFKYIFASEEYEANYPCTFTDSFALLLKKVGDPNYTNLAVLPNGSPVSVTNIRPFISTSCPAMNPTFFAGYNTASTETNFNGRTIPLTATANVIPGQTYHFKMVLADYDDNSFDTGVFLQAGSFNIGVQLTDPSGNPLPPVMSICEGQSQVITANVAVPGTTFQWLLNNAPIPGATSNSYTATLPGTYTLQVFQPNSACPETAEVVLNVTPLPVTQNATLTQCTSNTTAVFDLTSAQPNISTTPGVTFSYYANQADANAGNTNTIANPAAYTSGNATVYVLVKNGNCGKVANLTLQITPPPAPPTITSSAQALCNNGSITLTSSNATGNTWSTGATTQTITVTAPGTYTVTNTVNGCTSAAASITVNAAANPNVQITGNLVFCQGNSTTLTATASGTGNTFLWSTGATTPTITVNAGGTYTVTVTTAQGCEFTQNATVTVDTPPTAQNSSLSICSAATTGTFDLTSAQPSISTSPGATFSYYVNQADANAGNTNTIANPAAYTSASGVVYVRVTSGTCFVVVQLQLTVSQTVTPVITASSPAVCGSNSVTLTSNYATGNLWSTGATTQTITVSAGGTYTLTVTTGNCTSNAASITIAQDANPNLQITGNNFYCTGGSTTLTAQGTGVASYSWNNGATTPAITVNTAGTYTVTATMPGGCQFTQSITVTQSPVPTVQNAAQSLCSDTASATFDLTASQNTISTTPGVTFTYYATLADATAGNANSIATPNAFTTPTATVFVRVSNGNCFQVAQLQLTVTQTPAPTIAQSAPAICAGTPVTLTSNYATGNVWSTGATTQSIIVSTPGTYTLTTTNGNCPSQPVSVTIVANADPNVQITGNLAFCAGTNTTLTATSTGTGNTYAWSNGGNAASTTVNAPGTYTVTVTTPGGCQFTKSATVTMEPSPTINIAQPNQVDCNNPTVTLNASQSTFATGATILWTAGAGGNIVSGANTLTPVVNQGGNYTLTITNPTGLQCSVSQTVTVIKDITPPTIAVTASSLNICAGESVTLTASGAASYTWTGLTGNGSTQTVSPATTTTYIVTGIGTNGCQGNTAQITINVVPAIVSTLKDIMFCKGLTGVLDAGSGPNYTYLWTTGETTQTITVDTPGNYTVTINNGVCSKTFSATASYTPVPIFKEITYENGVLTIHIQNPDPNMEYSINGGLTWQDSNIFPNVQSNSNYEIRVRVKENQCYSSVEYYTYTIRNVITPNGDGHNDYIDFTEVSKYPNFKAAIFDRYGKEVFRVKPGKTIWNGMYINTNAPTGSYWYQIGWTDPISNKNIQKTGWILLKNRD